MVDCRYYSFYALARINDPEQLYLALQQQIAPGHADEIEIEVFERSDGRWQRLSPSGGLEPNLDPAIGQTLTQRFDADDAPGWYYDAGHEAWFCQYKPLTSKHFVLLVRCADPDQLIEEEYLQFLFHFYCHQLQMLQGTYRDALTGLYNRRAFNEKLAQLLERDPEQQRRAVDSLPTVFVMLDIDRFKAINDSLGHLFGDEVLLLLAELMIDSFRDNDLLFRYGGEEFALVLMDVAPEQARQTLERFREKVATHEFPAVEQVTVSIGFTRFDRELPLDALIGQADDALYHAKSSGRNAVYGYPDLVEQGLIPLERASDAETS